MQAPLNGYNLKSYLEILFVEQDSDDQEIFCRNSRIWEMLNTAGMLRQPVVHEQDPDSFHQSLMANNLGYLFINYTAQRRTSSQEQIQGFFYDLVKRLRPQLVIVMGRNTFEHLFNGRVRISPQYLQWGLTEGTISWRLCRRRTGSSFVFMMHRSRTFEGDLYDRALADLRYARQLLSDFRRTYPTLPPKNSSEMTNNQVQHGNQRAADFLFLINGINRRLLQHILGVH